MPEHVRGSVDRPANVQFVAGDARVDYLGATDRFFLKFDALAGQVHMVRGLLCRVWEGYDAGDNVIAQSARAV